VVEKIELFKGQELTLRDRTGFRFFRIKVFAGGFFVADPDFIKPVPKPVNFSELSSSHFQCSNLHKSKLFQNTCQSHG